MAPSDDAIAMPDVDPAAFARKRRIERRNLQRSGRADGDDVSLASAVSKKARYEEHLVDLETSTPTPSITGIKLQHRYDPGVRMSKDELKAWRKEARRVRNRESAAESRKRNRDRICELESEVDVLQSKYTAALRKIIELEACYVPKESFIPHVLRQDLEKLGFSKMVPHRPATPELCSLKTVSPPMSPTTSFRRISDADQHAEDVNKKYHHIMNMISRPAVSV